MIEKWPPLFHSLPQWHLYRLMFEILIALKPFALLQWFLLNVVSMTCTTYLNVLFFATITVDVTKGLQYLILLIIFENATSYCSLKQSMAKKTFVLNFLERFQTKLNQRILSANWIKIKLSDQVEVRRKIEEACSSAQYLVELFIEQMQELSKFLAAISTIFYICPLATLLIGVVYACFYRLYLNRQSDQLLDFKVKMLEKHDQLCTKYSRTTANMFEYVIHHEKNHIIRITNELKVDMEKQWFDLDYLYDYLSLKEDILGKLCTFTTIVLYYVLNGINTFIIPLYHYLSTLTDSIHSLLTAYIRWVRLKKDYDLVKPILEEYEERVNANQVDLTLQLQIRDLSFQYQGSGREAFRLRLDGSLTFTVGEAILITGKSGAGNTSDLIVTNSKHFRPS